MPVVSITILPQPTEKKAEMAKVITNEINRITGIPTEAIVVTFHELPGESCAANGELVSEILKRTPLK